MPGAKKSPFIVLESRNGQPLSLASVYDMFVVTRERFPDVFPSDFSTHVLRHTWNDRFMANAHAQGLKDALARQVNNYIMGWTKTSQQSANYSQREIERQASHLLMGMLSIGVQSGPPIGAQEGPPFNCEDRLTVGACFALLAA